MTVPLDDVNDIRAMDAAGVPRAEIARRLGLSRNTVAKYAYMADMSPAAPEARARRRRALSREDAAWVDAVLEADLGAPRKQRHSARRIYDRLVAERGYGGSYSTVQRRVREWRAARRAGGGEGYLELEWAPGTAQVDFGNFEADVAGERLALKLLAVSLPHSNARCARACMSQRSECMCEGLSGIFGQIGRAPAALVLDNATEAGRMVRARADKRGYVTVDGREYVAGPAWHSRELLVGVRAAPIEILADRGRRAALPPRAWGAGGPVRNPLSLVPALLARPRAFGESTIRRDMPAGLVESVDRMDPAGRRQTLRSISRAAEISGFEAACGAALRVVEGGRVPDDATVDVLARRIAGGGEEAAGGADLGVYDGFLKGGARHAGWRRARTQGGRCGQAPLAHHLGS